MALACEEEPPNQSIRARPRAQPTPLPISIETAPDQLENDGGEAAVSPPISLREIRARPLDVDKELPLLFVDDDVLADEPATSPVPPTPVARPDASGAVPISVPQYAPACCDDSGMQLRRFRRPTHMIRQQSTADKVEYEMDEADEAWLTHLNSRGARAPLLDCSRFEEMIDALERASFNAMHSQATGGADAWQQPTRQVSASAPAVQASSERKARRLPKSPTGERDKTSKPEKLQPPADEELRELPAELCLRYQQGRCHKGRACRWRHEIWDFLQQRSDERNRERGQSRPEAPGALTVGGPAHAADMHAAARFPSPACSCRRTETAASVECPLSTSSMQCENALGHDGRAHAIARVKHEAKDDALLPGAPDGAQGGGSAQPLCSGTSVTGPKASIGEEADFGVTLTQANEMLRGPRHVLSEVWHHWRSKRQQDAQKLPILASLRRDAAQMNARMAQFAASQSAMQRVISQLECARVLLELVKRREKLKRQIAAVQQVLFVWRAPVSRPDSQFGPSRASV